MKIEKVNDHQIRCTLTREDLADRELKLSELAYGTEKAKDLFRDMMQQASYEFGFEAEDIPLMIEAIPLNSECIVLIITKVEDPEELDTRFSKFAPSVHEDNDSAEDVLDTITEGADDVLDLFKKIQNRHASSSGQEAGDTEPCVDSGAARRSLKDALQKKIAESAESMELTKLYALKAKAENPMYFPAITTETIPSTSRRTVPIFLCFPRAGTLRWNSIKSAIFFLSTAAW